MSVTPQPAVPSSGSFLREMVTWVMKAFMVLGVVILAPAPVVFAGTDSTSSRSTLVPPALRWQFDTGG